MLCSPDSSKAQNETRVSGRISFSSRVHGRARLVSASVAQ